MAFLCAALQTNSQDPFFSFLSRDEEKGPRNEVDRVKRSNVKCKLLTQTLLKNVAVVVACSHSSRVCKL